VKIDNVKVYDMEECIKASKYPMSIDTESCDDSITNTVVRLAQCEKASGHDQMMTGIRVNFDLTCSNKMWVELERYRFIEFVSSQSTMHRITKLDIREQCNKYVWNSTIKKLESAVKWYNSLEDKTTDEAKELYLEILYNVPSGFELTARLTTNYRALKTVYSQRRNHKLPSWREFCEWIETLPQSRQLITGGELNNAIGDND